MKKWLVVLFGVFLLVGAQAEEKFSDLSHELDVVATANAPWKVGDVVYEEETVWEIDDLEKVKFSRVFQGVTIDGLYLVQDFIEGAGETDDPYLVSDEKSVTATFPLTHGKSLSRYPDGSKYEECLFEYGATIEPCIGWYRSGEKMWEYEVLEGVPHGLWRSWYRSGKQLFECDLNKGVGVCIEWSEDGQKKAEYPVE